jgi:all-trans-retinol 13,14-reductase
MMNENKYDVIVIGGGLSGLMAGVTAARRGKKTLILEKHASVGGLAAGFTRKGYYFDSGMSRCMGYIRGPLQAAGIMEKIELIPQRMIWNIAGCWTDYTSLERFFAGLADLFPEEKSALLALYQKEVRPVEAILATFFAEIDGKNPPQKFFHTLRLLGAMWSMSMSKSVKCMEGTVIGKYLNKGGRAYKFLIEREDEVDYRGEMSFMMKVGKWYSQIFNIYPSNGFQGLADEMENAIKSHNGEVRTSTSVNKLIIQNGRAMGVELEAHGQTEQIYAHNIIICIDLKKALHRLIGDRYLDADLLARLEKSKLSLAMPILYLGVDIPPHKIMEHFQGRDEVWYYPQINPVQNEVTFFRDHSMVVHSSCFHNPTHAPTGKTNLQIYLSCPPAEWMDNWGLKDGMRTKRYQEIKEMAIEHILGALEGLIPELSDRSRIEVCELGTPFTLERYTGNTDGSCLGFRMDADYINSRKIGQYFDRCASIANLYFAGQQTGYPGGVLNALGSGKHAGKIA